ncbi:MAG: hypothetical protein AB1776_07915 [Bacillota bacterium]
MLFHRWQRVLAALLCGGVLVGAGYAYGAAQSGPGTPQDPLVTAGWVREQVIEKHLQWRTVVLQPGQTLVCRAGAEFVIRAPVGNRGVVVDPTGNGLPDLTAGVNIAAGQTVPFNHLISVPASDGRGLRAVNRLWVMVRGECEVGS